MMKVNIQKASCHVEFDYSLGGSVLKGTVKAGCTGVRTHFEVESDAPLARLLLLVRNAKQGCFAESMITTAVPLSSTLSLNGTALSLDGITD